MLPFIILLSVPMAMLGALIAQVLRGQLNDVYCQIGLVMLIGLASKNGILIVEFAEQLRHKGLSIKEAAVEAARIRLRPILMTSFAFILGVLPLVFASGAGAREPPLRRDHGLRRDDRLHRAEPVLHSGAVRDRKVADRAREGARNQLALSSRATKSSAQRTTEESKDPYREGLVNEVLSRRREQLPPAVAFVEDEINQAQAGALIVLHFGHQNCLSDAAAHRLGRCGANFLRMRQQLTVRAGACAVIEFDRRLNA